MKKLIFYLYLIINFQNIYAMENEELSQESFEKAEKLLNFFKDIKVNQNNNPKAFAAIAYFTKPDSGIPICIKTENISNKMQPLSRFQKLLKSLEKKFLGQSLKNWKRDWRLEKLRRNNCYEKKYQNHEQDEHGIPYEIDEYGMNFLSTLREKIRIDKKVPIPIYKMNFCYTNLLYKRWEPSCLTYAPNNELRCYIETNSWLKNTYPDAIQFGLAHELSHLEIGSWGPLSNLLMTKIFLGGVGLLLSGVLLKNGNFSTKLIGLGCGLGTLPGIILANYSEPYFKRKNEEICDKLAVKLTESDKGAIDFFHLRPSYKEIIFEENEKKEKKWSICELKIKYKEPSDYSSWNQKLFATHPSPAERLRYCQDYAEQLQKDASDQNNYTYFCGYKIRKNNNNRYFGYKIRRDDL